MRQRGTIFIVLFILIAVAIVGVSRFMGAQPPVEYTLAVDPLAQAWADSAVNAFNASQPTVNGHRISFRVVAVDDLSVWQGQNVWTTKNHQDVWIPASHASVDYARANGLSLINVSDSLARTPMVWGGYISRANLLTTNGTLPLDWPRAGCSRQNDAEQLGSAWRRLQLGLFEAGLWANQCQSQRASSFIYGCRHF